jgi:hypothetical protein
MNGLIPSVYILGTDAVTCKGEIIEVFFGFPSACGRGESVNHGGSNCCCMYTRPNRKRIGEVESIISSRRTAAGGA